MALTVLRVNHQRRFEAIILFMKAHKCFEAQNLCLMKTVQFSHATAQVMGGTDMTQEASQNCEESTNISPFSTPAEIDAARNFLKGMPHEKFNGSYFRGWAIWRSGAKILFLGVGVVDLKWPLCLRKIQEFTKKILFFFLICHQSSIKN